jgi:hypothetical protein
MGAYPNSRRVKQARIVKMTHPSAIAPMRTPVRTFRGIVKISSDGASGSMVWREVLRSPRILRSSYIYNVRGFEYEKGGAYHHDRVAEECVVEDRNRDDLHRVLSLDGDTGEDGLPKTFH